MLKKFFLFFSVLSVICYGSARAEDKKVVLITGASKGIGLSTAQLLAHHGYTVYGTSREVFKGDSSIHYLQMDVKDVGSIHHAVSTIIEKEGHIDFLINNAGYALGGPVECLTMEEIQEQLEVNYLGPIRVCQEVIPFMRKQKKGHIINISSYQGVWAIPYGSQYSASKAALEALSEALFFELKPWNISVSIIEPGNTATKFSVKMGSRKPHSNPYEHICETVHSINELKKEKPELISPCQSPLEVAEVILQVMREKEPALRYQTSDESQSMVLIKLKEPSGKEYVKVLTALMNQFFEERNQ